MAVLYAAVGFSAYFYADEVMSLYSSGADIPDLPLLGIESNCIHFCIIFTISQYDCFNI